MTAVVRPRAPTPVDCTDLGGGGSPRRSGESGPGNAGSGEGEAAAAMAVTSDGSERIHDVHNCKPISSRLKESMTI